MLGISNAAKAHLSNTEDLTIVAEPKRGDKLVAIIEELWSEYYEKGEQVLHCVVLTVL